MSEQGHKADTDPGGAEGAVSKIRITVELEIEFDRPASQVSLPRIVGEVGDDLRKAGLMKRVTGIQATKEDDQ